jgi:hypothetical protein
MARSKDAKNTLGELDAKAVTRLVGAASDIALVLDDEGTILEVMTQRDELGARGAREWLGRPWVQTVTIESRQKVEALLREAQAAADAAGRWRQVNHPGQTCHCSIRRCGWWQRTAAAARAASWPSAAICATAWHCRDG